MDELEDWYSGYVAEARYFVDAIGCINTHYLRLESERGEDLGWITKSLHFHNLSELQDYISQRPRFLASDLGEVFLFEVDAPEEVQHG